MWSIESQVSIGLSFSFTIITLKAAQVIRLQQHAAYENKHPRMPAFRGIEIKSLPRNHLNIKRIHRIEAKIKLNEEAYFQVIFDTA